MKQSIILLIFTLGFLSWGCHSSSNSTNQNTVSDSLKVKKEVRSTLLPKLPDTTNFSVAGLFLRLQMDKTSYISMLARDSLLRFKSDTLTHYADDTEVLILDTLSHNYLRFELGYTTGQEGIITDELKIFPKRNGNFLLVFSIYGGTHGVYSQDEIRIFNVAGSTITENKDSLLPEKINIKEFVKEGVLDSVWAHLKDGFDYRYDLDSQSQDKVKILIETDEDLLPEDYNAKNWLKSNSIEFTWNGSTFSKKMIPIEK